MDRSARTIRIGQRAEAPFHLSVFPSFTRLIAVVPPRPAAGTADQTAADRTPAPAARTRTGPSVAARAPKRRARLRGRRARGTRPQAAIPLPRPSPERE